ncbi:MAG TPA: N-formylglutamate amidohydrolase [Polyangia bacterium]|nr:N-formylglutamate amidohydrolase [Polyangia bacterium]
MVDFVEGTFTSRIATEPSTPVVVSVPHAGTRTAGFDAALAPELDVRGDADLYVDRLYRIGEDGGPETYVAARLSRFICDLNRDPDDVSAGAVPEHPGPRNTDGRGFIWAVTTVGAPTLIRPLTLDEWRARTAVHAAYHDTIARALSRARERFGFAILVDGHSMPSRGRSGHTDTGRARADIVPGDREGRSCAPALMDAVRAHFERNGFSVRANEPYKGGFITAHHGRPADRIHAIQIEMRRDLYMNEETFVPDEAGVARVQAVLADLLAGLRALTL